MALPTRRAPYTGAYTAGASSPVDRRTSPAMAEHRIQPHHEQAAAAERRRQQRHAFTRNQVLGMLILAAVICAWWLFHTNPGWIFPAGWWRL
ncbi:MAG TPA: hypothetical protein VFI20_04785 [Terracidiphilus sp.]|nr:hypothetical protein [Terracidiphilus sp.]